MHDAGEPLVLLSIMLDEPTMIDGPPLRYGHDGHHGEQVADG
jgi:hypothetical protein